MGKEHLRLASTISPTPMKGSRTFAKPAFPATAIVTGHLAYPDADSTQWLTRLVKTAMAEEKDEKVTPEQSQAIEAVSSAAIGDAQSFAVEMNNGKPQVTVVNQYERDVNLPDVLRKNLPVLQTMDKEKKEELTIADADGPDGSKGIRVTNAGKDGKPTTVTVLQKGKVAVVRISEEELPPAPLTLSPTEKISELMALEVHLGAALQAAANSPKSPLAGMPEEKRKEMMTRLNGKDIRVALSNTGTGAMAMNLDVPVELLKMGAEWMTMMMGPGEMAPAPAPAPGEAPMNP
jgi:hypothetical protein